MIADILLVLALYFTDIQTTFAIDSPTQLSPTDQSTTSNSQVTWQALDGANEYRVIIDDDQNINSPFVKDYYTTSTKYSPQLSSGNYYWKVEARDTNNNWGTWSPIWSFVLSNSPESSPSPSENPKPTIDFSISAIPGSLNSNQSFSASINLLLPNNPNAIYYLKGAFLKSSGSNYFGFTKVNSSWLKNGSNYSSQYKIATDSSGHWSGNIDFMPDQDDSGFSGSGNYIFKVGYYSETGSGPNWSNEANINITSVVVSQPSPAKISPSIKPSIAFASPSVTSQIKSSLKPSTNSGTVAGIETTTTESGIFKPSPETVVSGDTQFNYLPFIGGGIVLIGLSIIVYIFVKARYNSNS